MDEDHQVNREKQSEPTKAETASGAQAKSHLDEFFEELKRGVYQPKSATLGALQRIALAMDAESGGELAENIEGLVCKACGRRNSASNRFCSSCGAALSAGQPQSPAETAIATQGKTAPAESSSAESAPPESASLSEVPDAITEQTAPLPPGQHYYHHHYHHHYFPAADGFSAPNGAEQRATAREVTRARSGTGSTLSRSEVAIRQLTQDWAQACNTKQLEDLLELYSTDAIVMRPNVLPMRGATVLREFFVALLESGFGEVELEPLRTEVFGEIAYEAGRCKMLIPIAMGKRREERGKYLILLARQSGEWKILADSWSADLTLGTAVDSDVMKSVTQSTNKAVSGTSRKG